jgi:hypothetical protein
MNVGRRARELSDGEIGMAGLTDQPDMLVIRQLVGMEMVELCVDHATIGVDDDIPAAAGAATTQSHSRVRKAETGRLGDLAPPLRQALLQGVDPVLDPVEPFDDLVLKIAGCPLLHMGANDAIEPGVKRRADLLGISHANLPMRPSAAAAAFLGENQQTMGLAHSIGDIFNKFCGLHLPLPNAWWVSFRRRP